jgi:hypothetical protein
MLGPPPALLEDRHRSLSSSANALEPLERGSARQAYREQLAEGAYCPPDRASDFVPPSEGSREAILNGWLTAPAEAAGKAAGGVGAIARLMRTLARTVDLSHHLPEVFFGNTAFCHFVFYRLANTIGKKGGHNAQV